MAVAGFIGYFVGKGKIEITKTANKEDSEAIKEYQEEMLEIQKRMEEEQQKHLEEYNKLFGGEV